MTDTAIPIPENLQTVMAPRVESALDVFRRAWEPVIEMMEHSAQSAGRALQASMAAAEQRRRVRTMMPALTMQEVLVHGYTPNKEA